MSLRSKKNLIQKLIANKPYRDAYVAEHVRNGIAFQLRTIRERLGWSQARMGQEVGKPQNVISRLEDPDYGRPNIQTLLEIAAGLNLALIVKFVPFSRLLKEYEDVSPTALAVKPITEEVPALEEWTAVAATSTTTAAHFRTGKGTVSNEFAWAASPRGRYETATVHALPEQSAVITALHQAGFRTDPACFVGSMEPIHTGPLLHLIAAEEKLKRSTWGD